MKTFPPGSPQAYGVAVERVVETIQGINECLPEESGVQAATAGLINGCTDLMMAQSVLALQLNVAVCWLANGGAPTNCNRPYSCGSLQVITTDTVNRSLNIWDAFASGFNFPFLVTLFGSLYFSLNGENQIPTMSFLEDVTLPLLEQADVIFCNGQPFLKSFTAPHLKHITGGDLNVSGNLEMTGLDLTALENVQGSLVLDGQLNTAADFPHLTTVNGTDIRLGGVDVAHVDITALTTFDGDFHCRDARLDSANVNEILIVLDNLGLSNHNVELTGGNMSPPTGAGLTAKSNLEGRGCTVGTE